MPDSSRPEPQAVVTPLTGAAVFLVVTVNPGGEETVRGLLGDIAGLVRAVGFRIHNGDLSCVAAVGSAAWDRLFDGPRPAELHPFKELTGPRHRAPHAGRPARRWDYRRAARLAAGRRTAGAVHT